MANIYGKTRAHLKAEQNGDIWNFTKGYPVHTTPIYTVTSGTWNQTNGKLSLTIYKPKIYGDNMVKDDDGKYIGCWVNGGTVDDLCGFWSPKLYVLYRFTKDSSYTDKSTIFKKIKLKKSGNDVNYINGDANGSGAKYTLSLNPSQDEVVDGSYFQLGVYCDSECEDMHKDDNINTNLGSGGSTKKHHVKIIWQARVVSAPKITSIRWYNETIEERSAYVRFTTSMPITEVSCNIGSGNVLEYKNDAALVYVYKINGLNPVGTYNPVIQCRKGSGNWSAAATTTVYTKGEAPKPDSGDTELHIDYIISKAIAPDAIIVDQKLSGPAGGEFSTVRPGHIEVIKMKPNSNFSITLTFESTLVHNPPPKDANGHVVNIAPERKDITITGKTKEVAVITSASDFEFYDDTLFNVVYDDDKEFTVELLHKDYHDGVNKCIWLHRFPNQKTASLKHIWTQDEKDNFYRQWPTNSDREHAALRITTLGKYKTEANKAWYTKEVAVDCILTGKNYTGHINIAEGNNFKRCRCWINITGRNDGWKPCIAWINTADGFRRST